MVKKNQKHVSFGVVEEDEDSYSSKLNEMIIEGIFESEGVWYGIVDSKDLKNQVSTLITMLNKDKDKK